MPRTAILVGLLLLLAGCSEPDAEPVTAAAEPGPEEPSWQRFEATYDLTRSEVHTPASSSGMGGANGNCIMLDDDAVVSGTATVTWDPGPTDPEMELVLVGPDDLQFQTGDGEIVLELDNFTVEGEDLGGSALAWQVASSTAAGAVLELTGTLVVVFDVLLEDPEGEFTPDDNWSCSIGH